MTPEEHRKIAKEAFKESYREWLDEIYKTTGRWALRSLIAALAVGLFYLMLQIHGWNRIPEPPSHFPQHKQ